ncbi:hypothetical protein [Paraburkholderia sp. BL10I2N1]|uniref:hypothetical protein n=1 Tax=Paraburkholderia sp. BL10I2N1 TaxID=1938796 RepID=UPI001414FA68|nr:hypothetical protein [Paraburkholderia sp. BL10I2N1]
MANRLAKVCGPLREAISVLLPGYRGTAACCAVPHYDHALTIVERQLEIVGKRLQ